MKEEFCHNCGAEIGELFWIAAIEEKGNPKIIKLCTDPECFGRAKFYLMLEKKQSKTQA